MNTAFDPRRAGEPSSGAPLDARMGTPLSRVDGRSKVTGSARYAAEFDAAGLVHGALVNAAIARGEIVAIDASAAQALPGVLLVLTHENRTERTPPFRRSPPTRCACASRTCSSRLAIRRCRPRRSRAVRGRFPRWAAPLRSHARGCARGSRNCWARMAASRSPIWMPLQ